MSEPGAFSDRVPDGAGEESSVRKTDRKWEIIGAASVVLVLACSFFGGGYLLKLFAPGVLRWASSGGNGTEELLGAALLFGPLLLIVGAILAVINTREKLSRFRRKEGSDEESSVREPGRKRKGMTKDEAREAIMSTRYPPPDAPSAEEFAALLTEAKVARRSGGGGTLMTEPIVVVHGEHGGYFKLFDQDGRQLGSAVPVHRPRASASRAPSTREFRDAHDRCVFHLQDVGPRFFGPGTKCAYEISAPGGSGTISVKRVRRSTATASITEGPRQIGMMRPPDPSRVALAFRRIGIWVGE